MNWQDFLMKEATINKLSKIQRETLLTIFPNQNTRLTLEDTAKELNVVPNTLQNESRLGGIYNKFGLVYSELATKDDGKLQCLYNYLANKFIKEENPVKPQPPENKNDITQLTRKFDSILEEKTRRFVGRKFVFNAFENFINQQDRGYFTLVGYPGSGKSAVSAFYIQNIAKKDCVYYFNIYTTGQNKPDQFLENVCQQLIKRYDLDYPILPNNYTRDGEFLTDLLTQISQKLQKNNDQKRLIIVIDALDEVNLSSQDNGSNVLYLPRYLPKNIYFFLTRRRELDTRLLFEAPELILDLKDYFMDSEKDIKEFINLCFTDPEFETGLNRFLANNSNFNKNQIVEELAKVSNNNFMYLRYVIPQIALEVLPLELANSFQWERLIKILTDFDFLQAKIKEVGIQELIDDYDLIDHQEDFKNNPQFDPEKTEALKLIQKALILSSHILKEDPKQLVSQLFGRLGSFVDLPHPPFKRGESGFPPFEGGTKGGLLIKTLLLQTKNTSKPPLLNLYSSTLTPPSTNLIRTLTGHSSYVLSVTVTPDGTKVISGSWDKTLKVWDLATVKELRTLTGHSDSIMSVTVTPDGTKVVSGSWDNTVKVWELATVKELYTLIGHSDRVTSVTVTPDGTKVISGSHDKTVKVWELATGKELHPLTGHSNWVTSVTVTPDGTKVISGSHDKTVKVWELATGKELHPLTGHSDSVNSVTVTPDGTKVISGSNDNTLKVWELATGECLATFIADSPIFCCAVSPDGLTIVAGDASGRVHFLRWEGV